MRIEMISRNDDKSYVLDVSSAPHQVGNGGEYLYYAITMNSLSSGDQIRWRTSRFYNPKLDQLHFPKSDFELT